MRSVGAFLCVLIMLITVMAAGCLDDNFELELVNRTGERVFVAWIVWDDSWIVLEGNTTLKPGESRTVELDPDAESPDEVWLEWEGETNLGGARTWPWSDGRAKVVME